MPHWKSYIKKNSTFLCFYDLEGVSPVVVEISGYKMMKAYNPGEHETNEMLCLSFKGGKKALGLCNTNGHIIESVTGESDPDNWIGKKITLRVAECKGTPCVRVDAPDGMSMPAKYPKFSYQD